MNKKKKWIILTTAIVVLMATAAVLLILILQWPRLKQPPAPPKNIPAGSTLVWRLTDEYARDGMKPGYAHCYECTYDDLGRCIETVHFGDYHTTYEYLPVGNKTRVVETGETERRIEEFDQAGDLTYEALYRYSDDVKDYLPYIVSYYEKDLSGEQKEVAREIYENGKLHSIYVSSFDHNENIRYTAGREIDPDENIQYDGDWKNFFGDDLSKYIIRTEKYDLQGHLLQVKDYSEGSLTEEEYRYDSEGRLIEKYQNDPDGSETLKTEYEYFPNGSYTMTSCDEATNTTYIRKFDPQDREIQNTEIQYGKIKKDEKTVYRRIDLADGGYKKIEEKIWTDGVKDINEKEYNAQGEMVHLLNSVRGEAVKEIRRVYDDRGRIIEYMDISGDYKACFEYDEYGNQIRMIEKSGQFGQTEHLYEYTPMVLTDAELQEAGEYYCPDSAKP